MKYFKANMAALAISAALLAGYGSTAMVCAQDTTAAYANTVSAEISEAEAYKAAVDRAGLAEDDVVFRGTELDFDDFGILKYEVEFYADDKAFRYDIDAETGDIIEEEYEKMEAEDYTEMKDLRKRAAKQKNKNTDCIKNKKNTNS